MQNCDFDLNSEVPNRQLTSHMYVTVCKQLLDFERDFPVLSTQIQFGVLLLYVVYSMKWTQESWLHTRCKLPRDVVTMALWSRAIFTYFWFKKWRINSMAPKLIEFWFCFLSDLTKKIHFELRNHSDGDNGVTNRLTVDRGKTSTFKFILR